MNKRSNNKKLSKEEVREILIQIQNGDMVTRDKFIESNFGLVGMVVRKYISETLEYDDAFQIGCIALIKAIDNFNLKFDVEFSTYAVPMISGELRRYVRDNTTIKIPRKYRDIQVKVFYAKKSYLEKYGEEPTMEQLSKIIEISEKEIVEAMKATITPMSISEPIGHNKDGDEMSIDDIIGTEPDELINSVIANIKNEIVREALKKLTTKEQKIILLRYGLADDKNLTQGEIAEMYNESQSYIACQEQKALIKMRHPKITRKLKDFIDE
ncbi:MAG: sigma-70 family RNA polymerase sigma factor [Bacilli bacterium]